MLGLNDKSNLLTESEKRELMLELEELAQFEGLRNYAQLGTELGISAETQTLIDSKAEKTEVLKHDGSVSLTNDWDAGDGRVIKTDKIMARDADGLILCEDGENGIFVKDGGNIGIGTTTPLAKLSINGGLHVGGDSDPGDNNLLVDGRIQIDGDMDHNGSNIGFFGVSLVIRQSALTSQITTINCSNPNTPDYAISDPINTNAYGFLSADEFKTVMNVITNLQTRLAELENRLKNYGLLQ